MYCRQKYFIRVYPNIDSDVSWMMDEYKWSEGDSEKFTLGIYKEVKENKQLSDLEEFTVSANTQTIIDFTVDELCAVCIDTDNVKYELFDQVESKRLSLYDYNYSFEKGIYTLELDPVDKDTIIKFRKVNDKSHLIYKKCDKDSDGSDEGIKVIKCSSTVEDVVVPDEFEGLPIIKIAGWSFKDYRSLKSIKIPDGVTSIGERAFNNCANLESIIISNPDCEIYDSADTINNGYDENISCCYFNGTIYGYDNSTAEAYAEKYNYNFESLSEAPVITTPAVTTAPITTTTKPIAATTTPEATKPLTTTTTPTTTEPITTTTPAITYEKGDANGDGKITIKDARFIAKLIAGRKKDELPPWADYNGDGKVTIKDAREIARYIANRPR